MKELQRLVRIINKNLPASSPLINLQEESTLESRLFRLLRDCPSATEQVVAEELYGTKELPGSHRMLKSRFRKKIFNHLHFLNLPSDNLKSSNEVLYVCYTLLVEAQALILQYELKAALRVLEQLKQIATKYENTEMQIRALETLRGIYQDLRKLKELALSNAELEACYKVQAFERKALLLYDKMVATLKGHVADKAKALALYPEVISKLWEMWESSGSSKIFSQWHILQIAYHELRGDYEEIISLIAKSEKIAAEEHVNKNWYNRKYNAYIEVYAHLQSRQYERGLLLAAEHIKLFDNSSSNWFSFMENYVLLALHHRDYEVAVLLLKAVVENEHLKKLSDSSLERWELYRLYLLFFQENALADKLYNTKEIANKLLILPKDKSGFNLALLVLDVLNKLAEETVDDLEPHAERVRKYVHKYLKGEKAVRPRLFMRLVLLALTKDDPEELREQSADLLVKLQAAPLPGDAFAEVEIVPYEHLWDLIGQLLEKRRAR
ncbi:hypothetical protein [Pontibacter mangrovi]|uniref:MalT-like TPR region domain-containing protein n=1 Tax=Pontibacter mangrovi TaxID=2589816 RepID=A0A501W3G5_9BACT|nr:hypothetical protein [Pontibacter mangrovi]TPE43302.1 hypothetical protein FJM65_14420 [Pontibacter mangrovi]